MTGIVLITGSSRGIGAASALLAAKRGWAVCVNYVSKADRAGAVVAAIRAAGGKAIAPEGIRVNAIMPGLIDTEIHIEAGVGDRLHKMIPQGPMGRIGTAQECAEAIVWLMSGEAAYMTGANLLISGGR